MTKPTNAEIVDDLRVRELFGQKYSVEDRAVFQNAADALQAAEAENSRLKAVVEAAKELAEDARGFVSLHPNGSLEYLSMAVQELDAALAQPSKTFPDTNDYIRSLTQEIAALRLHIENRDNGLDVLALDALEHANEIRDAAVKPGAGQGA
jgi:hypothetical protein